MRLPATSETAQARPVFNWIDHLAVPIISSIMETQPIAMLLLVLPLMFDPGNTSSAGAPLLNSLLISGLLLSLHWWEIFVHFKADSRRISQVRNLRFQGFLIALVITLSIELLIRADIIAFFFAIALVIWSWRRGMLWTEFEMIDDRLILTFKAGFILLILTLLLTILRLYDAAVASKLLQAQALALPLFFLSGLITLSFTRLSATRKENARSVTGKRLDSSRTWLTVLAIAWIVLVALSIGLELFSFQLVQNLFQPVWYALEVVFRWFLSVIDAILAFLLAPLHGLANNQATPPPLPTPIDQPQQHPLKPGAMSMSPLLLLIARIALVAVVLSILGLIVWFILRRKPVVVEDEGEREVREGLGISALFKAHRPEREREQEPAFALETLDPASARAHYRELLQTM
ncbi:MAG: hypothetical protein J2P36_12650, partial [Ktedonobacteraceae bacterium]|nr:hypothetical protein [Ktedonobacteraceae bacterium]